MQAMRAPCVSVFMIRLCVCRRLMRARGRALCWSGGRGERRGRLGEPLRAHPLLLPPLSLHFTLQLLRVNPLPPLIICAVQ